MTGERVRGMSRRQLLARGGCALCLLAFSEKLLPGGKGLLAARRDPRFERVALHWKKKKEGSIVQCRLCPNECTIADGERGLCRVRENRRGTLYTLVYSRLAAVHVDPVEKKPFYHLLPGSLAFSVATAGCNMSCKFCQNWELSQSVPEDLDASPMSPSEFSGNAKRSGARVVAFTYNEPTVQYEYIMDAAQASRKLGLRPVIVSNGYIRPNASAELAARLDAVKIDLKAFTQRFYADICGGNLKDVLKNLETVKGSGRWLEIVVLIIPTLNDSPREIREMSRWVRANLSPNVPMHFSRFRPIYLMKNLPPTPVSTLERCREIARAEGVRYAYVGNVPGHRFENTYCHSCGRVIIKRGGFAVVESLIRAGKCTYCGTAIPGIWA